MSSLRRLNWIITWLSIFMGVQTIAASFYQYPLESRLDGRQPVIIYLAIDSLEPFMQITVDHEVNQLKKLCVSNPRTKAIILISSQIAEEIRSNNLPKITYCNEGKVFSKALNLPSLKNVEALKESPLINGAFLEDVLDFVTGSTFPFTGQGFFLQLKSHGFKDNVAVYLNAHTLAGRVSEQAQELKGIGITWHKQDRKKLGTGIYEAEFRSAKQFLTNQHEQTIFNSLGDRGKLSSSPQEADQAPKLSEVEFTGIIDRLEKKGRLFAAMYLESCQEASSTDSSAEDSKLNQLSGFVYRAPGNLNYHNFDWNHFHNKMGQGDNLFFGLIAHTHEIQNLYPKDDILLDIFQNDIQSFTEKVSRGIGAEPDFYHGRPLIWYLLLQRKMNFVSTLLRINPNLISDLFHKNNYDLFKDCLAGQFQFKPLSLDIIKKIFFLQNRNDIKPLTEIENNREPPLLQWFKSDLFNQNTTEATELLGFLLGEFTVNPQTLIEVKPLDTVHSLNLNLLEICVLYDCNQNVKKSLIQLGFSFGKTEDAKWVRILEFEGAVRGFQFLISQMRDELNPVVATELAAHVSFNPYSESSILHAHAKLKYLLETLNADFLAIPFGKDRKWFDDDATFYFKDLVRFFQAWGKSHQLSHTTVETVLNKRLAEIEVERIESAGFGEPEDDQFAGTPLEFLGDAYSSEDIHVFENIDCKRSIGMHDPTCEKLLTTLAYETRDELSTFEREQNNPVFTDSGIQAITEERIKFLKHLQEILDTKGIAASPVASSDPGNIGNFSALADRIIALRAAKQPWSLIEGELDQFFDKSVTIRLIENWPDLGEANELIFKYIFSGKNPRVNEGVKFWLEFTPDTILINKYFVEFLLSIGPRILTKEVLFARLSDVIENLQKYENHPDSIFDYSTDTKRRIFEAYHNLGRELNLITVGEQKVALNLLKTYLTNDSGNINTPGLRSDIIPFLLCKKKEQKKLGEIVSTNYLDFELKALDAGLRKTIDTGSLGNLTYSTNKALGPLQKSPFACLFEDQRTRLLSTDANFNPPNYSFELSQKKADFIYSQYGPSQDWRNANSDFLARSSYPKKVYAQLVTKAKILIKYDPSILHVRDFHGRTFLHWAAYLGDWAIMKALLESGANPNQTDSKGRSILDYFFRGKNLSYDVLLMLRDYGFNFEVRSKEFPKQNYFKRFKAIPLKEIDTFNIVNSNWPKYSPKLSETKESYREIDDLRHSITQNQYYLSLVFLRQFK